MSVIENKLEFYEVPQRGEPYIRWTTASSSLSIPGSVTVGANTRIKLKFQITDFGSPPPSGSSSISHYLFSFYGLTPSFGIDVDYNGSVKWIVWSTGGYYAGAADQFEHVLEFDGTSYYLDGALLKGFSQPISDQSGGTFFNSNNIYYDWDAKIYYFQIYSGSTLTRNFIPAIRDGHAGLYDTIAGTFVWSSQADVFVPGDPPLLFDVENDQIDSIHSVEALSFLGDELSYDTMETDVRQKVIMETAVAHIACSGDQHALIGWQVTDSGGNYDRSFDITLVFSNDLTSSKFYQHILCVDNCCRLQYNRLQQRYELFIRTGEQTTETLNIPTAALPVDTQRHVVRITGSGTLEVDEAEVFTGLTIYNNRAQNGSLVSLGNWATESYSGNYPFTGKIYSCDILLGTNSRLLFAFRPAVRDGEYGLLSSDSGAIYSNRFCPSVTDVPFAGELTVETSYGDDLTPMPYGTPVLHYMDDVLAARYYIEEMKRTGLISFGISGISAIGLLSRQYHKGGLFSGESFVLVVSEILGDSIDYSVSQELGAVQVYGHLPYATRRDNLRQLLFATNGHVFRDADRQIYFDFLDGSEAVEILDENIFENGSVEYPKLATKVTLTEHDYYYYGGVSEVTLFDNTNGYAVEGLLVKFQNAPIYPASLATTGTLTFRDASVNCAIVTGQGTLTGKPYVHTTLDLVRYDDNSGREEYEVSVTDATLVTAVNGEGVADRVADYWFHRHIIKADIKWSGERCGKLYSVKNAFLEEEAGYLVKMEKVVSSFVRASCEFIAGVGSGDSGNVFEHYAVITSSGSWSIPEGVDTIRLILVGGGSGGQSGLKGKDGNNSSGGAGGNAGAPGSGGRIYILTLTGVSGSLSVVIGTGGVGGAACSSDQTPNEGTDGNPTTVTIGGMTYTSSAGARSQAGVENIFTGNIYALPGEYGTAGAPGGSGREGASEAGSAVGNKTGGAPGSSAFGMYAQTSGGAGSGASATTNGSAGGNASVVHVESSTSSEWFDYYSHTPGAGANGVAATQRAAATTPGAGGDGGHGGGGAGGCGVFNGNITDQWEGDVHIKIGDERSSTAVSAGVGGNGGAGGNGAAGCVIIYY